MMPRIKASNTSKIKSVLYDFPDKLTQNPNNKLYCNLCKCVLSYDKRFLVDSHWKTSKHQKTLGRSKLQMPQTSQTFLTNSSSDFVKKLTRVFLSADIPLYKLNNKHVKNLFSYICHSLLTETTCRKTVLKLSPDKLQRIRNVDDKQIFQAVDESTLSGIIQIFYLEP